MAAARSNRSPSPLCSRPVNPNPRDSENKSAIRRSFSGTKPSSLTNLRRFDPITPANSPSDFARKLSFCEEKENGEKEHLLKASKLHSPAKGCKNFMSPTISAASKFTPSPRKKALVERNDPVRTSISLSDGKAMFFSNMSPNVSEDFDSKSDMGFHQNQKSECFLDPKVADSLKMKVDRVAKPSKRVSFSDVPSDSFDASESYSDSVITDSDCLKFDSVSTDSDSLKVESSLENEDNSSNSIAPLDADPSLPPYDAKTNYLSPRPQFLRYKPNPRIGILLNKERGLDPEGLNGLEEKLKAEIMSGNFSDSSEGTEESQTESAQNEEMEVAAPIDMAVGMDETEVDSHPSEPSSEPLPVSTHIDDSISKEDFVQKNGKKSRTSFRLMCFSVLLMFFIACVSVHVIHSPSHDQFVLKDLSLSDMSNFYHQLRTAIAAPVKVNFDRLARRANQLSVSSVYFVSKLANELGNGERQVPLQFLNISDLQRNAWKERHLRENEAILQSVESLEEDEVGEDSNGNEVDIFEEEEAYGETNSDEKFEKRFDSQDDGVGAETDMFGEEACAHTDADENEISIESVELEKEIQSQMEVESLQILWNEQNSAYQPVVIPQDQETYLKDTIEVTGMDAETEKSQVEMTTPGSSVSVDAQLDANAQSEGTPSSLEENSFVHKAIAVSSIFIGFLAVAAFLYQFKREPGLANIVQPGPPSLSKEKSYGIAGKKHNIIHQETELSQNWQTEADTNEGESSSCPSGMSSSFEKSASYSKKGGANEVENSERKKARKFFKRESMASSSELLSPSYGSFTTFERNLHQKHANGEEEIVTPVRRSSRIRNKVIISP